MARARFIAAGHHNQICEAFGRKFPHNEWVDLKGMDPAHVETLAANPTFEAELDPPPPPKKVKGAAAAAETQPESNGPGGDEGGQS